MLKDYIQGSNLRQLTIGNISLLVKINGEIGNFSEETTYEEFKDISGDLCVITPLWKKYGIYRVAEIIALAFKPTKLPDELKYALRVTFVDGEHSNIHPSNLIWQFPVGLECTLYPGYAYIPGFSRYVINKNSDCLDTVTGNLRNRYISAGYYHFSLYPDYQCSSQMIVGVHRCLGLAWLQYGADIDALVTNHKNGIKLDNDLANLEWVTRSQNVIHALETDLNSKKLRINRRNVLTGEIAQFRSISACASASEIDSATMRFRIQQQNQLVYSGKYQFKLDSDIRPWRTINNLCSESIRPGIPRRIEVKDIFSGHVREYESIADAERGEGRAPGVLKSALRLRPNLANFNLLIRNKDAKTEWPEISEKELLGYRQRIQKRISNGNGSLKNLPLEIAWR